MKLKSELPLIIIVLIPFIYLISIWNTLPERVPVHWNINGEIDRYGSKIELVIIPILLPLLTYALLTAIPKLDPKNKLNEMGNKLQSIKFLMTLFMSILAVIIIYSAQSRSITNPNIFIGLIGVLFIIFGNYFQTIRPNYFIGIRTPWTLENESNWKRTHYIAGIIWLFGGIVVVLSSLFLDSQTNLILFLIIVAIMVITPTLYSYLLYRNQSSATS